MSLAPGTKLGPYEILAPIGAGGMGEVYRAHDSRLDRDVAIKVSSERFSERFSREAHAIAALNHPNVCQVYDVGPNYLVMELVDGPTLAECIRKGAMPLDEALKIARQIADGLDAAHEKGIVHRDLKPGNVKIKPDGTVKVLDFGLAKAAAAAAAQFEDSPTLAEATETGMILGTPSYMSPEQATGKSVDRRADIWAFGVVLYEMVTGKQLFGAETTTEVLASVLKEEPKWDQVPTQIQRLLRRCLEKDPQQRLRHIGDVMALVGVASAVPQPPAGQKGWLWPSVAALLLITTTAALGYLNSRGRTLDVQEPERRYQIPIPENTAVGPFAVSPDGRWLVFRAAGTTPRLWLRTLDSLEAHPLNGTESAAPARSLFWSPDSRFIAFAGVDGKLKKIDTAGGPPENVGDLPDGYLGGSWNTDGVIIFGSQRGVMRISAGDGTPSAVTVTDAARAELSHVSPSFLPDGRHFVYFAASGNPENQGIYIGSVDAKPDDQRRQRLLAAGFSPVYAPSRDPRNGQLLFLREGTLMAQTLDAGRFELTGEPVSIAQRVGGTPADYTGFFTASATGVLIYRNLVGDEVSQLTWYDRQGKPLGAAGEPRSYTNLALSPDGTRASVVVAGDIWLVDLARGTSIRLTTTGSLVSSPGVWSPDGSHIAFTAKSGGILGIYQKASSGAGTEELLWSADGLAGPTHWSSDGNFLLFGVLGPKTGTDVWALPLKERKPFPVLQTEFFEIGPRFSPNNRWIAYRSNESGKYEIYVQPFSPQTSAGSPGAAARWPVSKGGTVGMPRWRSDGKELYYLTAEGKIMAVEITTNPSFRAHEPKILLQTPAGFVRGSFPGALGDVAADGNKFLLAMPVDRRGTPQDFTVVLNWTAVLKK